MILNEPDYQKAIDAIDNLFDGGRVTGQLAKELNMERAGLRAEKQMAYQLKSYFQSMTDLFVWNNLKLAHGDITAQIDHIVFSRRAFWIIESKSISDTVTVNELGEFHRIYRGKPSGIKSPIEQVKRQQQVFLDVLKANKEKFLGTILGMQKGLGSWTPTVFVAVSERGKISGQGRNLFKKELRKFDQIASEIKNVHDSTSVGLLKSIMQSKPETMNLFSESEIEKLVAFLKSVNIAEEPYDRSKKLVKEPRFKGDILPEAKAAASSRQMAGKSNNDEFTCSKCGSKNLVIAFGRSYYFKCRDCDGNSPINLVCGKCGTMMRTQKEKNEFYKCCEKCGAREQYFVNKDA